MASVKRSISFPPGLLEAAQRAAADAPYAGNLSGLVTDAVRHHLQLVELRELVADHEREHGPFTGEERARVDAEWPA